MQSMLSAVAGTLVVILASVIAVRAYLTAQTDLMKNKFSSKEMTYTDTSIFEPGGSSYTIDIDNQSKIGTLKSNSTDKSAQVHNSDGIDKKPVFVRVTMVMNIYDSNGVNVTRDYPECTPTYVPGANWGDNWVADSQNTTPVCYYYKHILVPNGYTSNVFDSVTIAHADKLPQNATVKIRVMTDTVQAVETDDVNWTAADYTESEVAKAWSGATAEVDTSDLTDLQLASQVTAPVNWSFTKINY